MQRGNRFLDTTLTSETQKYLETLAKKSRVDILTMTTLAGSGHPGGSMSSIEIFLSLYYFLNINPENLKDPHRDRVVVSHGHTSPGVYSALGNLGFFDIEDAISYFRLAGSPFEGHIERHIPGVEWSTGNLGQGLSAGCGFAVESKIKKLDNLVFVVMGDGEQQKGQLSEARRFAKKYNLNNLFAIIDYNRLQISGSIENVMPQNIKENYLADNWKVFETDGNNIAELYNTLYKAIKEGGPAVIIARTVMGKGISFMENIKDYHGKALTIEQYEKAISELGFENKIDFYMNRRKNFIFSEDPFKANHTFTKLKTPSAIIYPPDKKIDNRSAFGEALLAFSKENHNGDYLPVAVFDCDLASSVKVDAFAKNFPDNFFQSGIQEHNTATISGSLSTTGILSVFADFGVFGIDEVYNQQRLNDINNTNLKVVCTHLGIDVGEDGKTHQCIDYLGLLRNLFGFKVILPADANQTYKACLSAFSDKGNYFIGMGRSVTPVITKEDGSPFFDENYNFIYGKADVIRDGTDLAILSYGVMLHRALKIRELLQELGINAMILNIPTPKELDLIAIKRACETGKLVVYEDHNINTGLGDIISSYLYDNRIYLPLLKLGVNFYSYSGTPDEVFKLIGLSPAKACDRIIDFFGFNKN
ncbi:MAG: transketolase [Proteobacteria bacterium]|nr:transketolase [Pseudomonadota bacterium]